MMGRKLKKKIFILTISFLVVLISITFAGTTGKIKGFVIDSKSGKPLVGVNVVLEGTYLGSATGQDGSYVILNVPPGYYDVIASMIGYKKVIKKNVQVLADRTIEVNFELEPSVIQGQEIVVEAKRPMVRRDETSKAAVLDFTVFQEMPIREFEEAVAVQAGMVEDAAGDLHLRGGRAGEIAYMVDGVLVQDPFYKSGAAAISLDKYVIQELQLLTGAFSAEYGQAMSGVINIVTREGKKKEYNLRLEYESPVLNESPFRRPDWMLYSDFVDVPEGQENLYRDAVRMYRVGPNDTIFSSTPTPYDSVGISKYKVPEFTSIPGVGELPKVFGSPLYGYMNFNLSGPIPFSRRVTFFTSSRYSNNPSFYPFGYDARREINFKLTYRVKSLKMNASTQRSKRYYKPFAFLWKYNPEGLEDRRDIVNRESFDLTHTLSSRTFYVLRLSKYYHRYYRFNPKRKFKISDYPEEIWRSDDKIDSVIVADGSDWQRYKTNSDGFYISGDRGRYEDNRLTTYSVRFDFVSQVNDNHEVKAGFEYKSHVVQRDRWRYPWPGSAHYVEIYTRKPEEFAAYIQDKMEYERFVLNLGLRYDYMNPHATMWEDIYTPGYLDDVTGKWIPAPEVEVKPKIHWSPRIGIAYPVTDKIVFHSNYGHFYENPSFYTMYKHHDVTGGGIPLVGNPAIKSQKTVQYEFGVKTQIGEEWTFDVNAYFKDITNYAGSTYRFVFPYNFTVFDNSDYASVKGIDFSLEKKAGRFFTCILNYTISVAKGNESSESDGYNYYRGVDATLRPNKEYYLDFDRRHDIAFNAIFRTPKGFGPSVLGFHPLSEWNVNILAQVASGLPYTPFVEEGQESVYIERNTGRKPWTSEVDLRMNKRFRITRGISLEGFVVVRNLFNKLNVRYVWTRTGKPWDAGPTSSYSQDRIHNLDNVGLPRRITAGIRFVFNRKA